MGKISILFLSADPIDASHLRLGEEFREIQEKLQLSKGRKHFDLHVRMSTRPQDITQALLDVQPQIVHFSGHGTDTGYLCLENKDGKMHPVSPIVLGALFKQFSGQVQLVLLNACYSAKQAQTIAEHVDYVVGMTKSVGDKAAIAFSVGFYQALGAGKSVEEAFEFGKIQMGLQNIPEHLTPVLISSPNLPPRRIAHSNLKEISLLLEACGYRILDDKTVNNDHYFYCETHDDNCSCLQVVHFVGGKPTVSDIAALNDAVVTHDAESGVIISEGECSSKIVQLVKERPSLRCYTLGHFIRDKLETKFQPYLHRIISSYKTGDISDYYVSLLAENRPTTEKAGKEFFSLEDFVEQWARADGRNHLTILGEFGTGKTWFSRRLTYLWAKQYLAKPDVYRIPVLVKLRDFSYSNDLEFLVVSTLRRDGVELPAGFRSFDILNRYGRVLLILDGFDEMEQKISDYHAPVDSFWRLSHQFVKRPSKVILTSRPSYFRDFSEEEETLTPKHEGIAITRDQQLIDLRGHEGFEVVKIREFTEEQVRLAIQKRFPTQWARMYKRIKQIYDLADLARRPLLLDIALQNLSYVSEDQELNQASLYQVHVTRLLERRWSEKTDFLSPDERLLIIQELAWKMYMKGKLSIHYTALVSIVEKYIDVQTDRKRLEFTERDLRTQSYLVRDESGNYSFAHKSFMEFFVAQKAMCCFEDERVNFRFLNEDDDLLGSDRGVLMDEYIRTFLRKMIKNTPIEKVTASMKTFWKAELYGEVEWIDGDLFDHIIHNHAIYMNFEEDGTLTVLVKKKSHFGWSMHGYAMPTYPDDSPSYFDEES